MQFTTSILALAAAVAVVAHDAPAVVTVTQSQFVTVCPAASTVVYGAQTFTNTLTIVRGQFDALCAGFALTILNRLPPSPCLARPAALLP